MARPTGDDEDHVPEQTHEEIVSALAERRSGPAPAGRHGRSLAGEYLLMSGEGLRQPHAHAAAERAAASGSYESEGRVLVAWTRQGPRAAPWTALVLGAADEGGATTITAGYRLLAASPEEAAALAGEPEEALATLFTRYGLLFSDAQEHRVRLAPAHAVRLPASLNAVDPLTFADAISLERPPEGTQVAASIVAIGEEKNLTRFAWLYLLDLTRYEEDVRAARRR